MIQHPAEATYFYLVQRVHTGSDANPTSYLMSRGHSTSEDKQPAHEDDH